MGGSFVAQVVEFVCLGFCPVPVGAPCYSFGFRPQSAETSSAHSKMANMAMFLFACVGAILTTGMEIPATDQADESCALQSKASDHVTEKLETSEEPLAATQAATQVTSESGSGATHSPPPPSGIRAKGWRITAIKPSEAMWGWDVKQAAGISKLNSFKLAVYVSP